jgi:HD-GYP domain-containing protein (c-di-GMP phosphodiesterase class II)
MAERSGACTPGRGKRVAATAVLLGREIGMRPARLALLAETALLLDIGFIGMPLDVVQRSRPLTDDEKEELELHPMRGLDLARDLGLEYEQLNGIMHHHERQDGLGYPMGLAGQEIPEFARILAIADAYDDLTKSKAGCAALPPDDAMRQLHQLAGTHFDPILVSAFSRAVNEHEPNGRGTPPVG